MVKIIAIDGPSGAGKSSVARALAEKLGYLHVDSGALYRIYTWQALERGIDTTSPDAIAEFAKSVEIECAPEAGRIAYRVNGYEPKNEIREPRINAHTSEIAREKAVRDRVSALLRELVKFGNLVVEGRDITTAVFPETPARFYLTASAEARAARRAKQDAASGIKSGTEANVKASLLARDAIDSTRKYAPLTKADGVLEIDSTNLTFDETFRAAYDALPQDWRMGEL
ncbi:MAG: (d)CMP kinase [Kiritimatiellae bacterium]|nr:(d)CMP kinase [Kiritimatiellia bacterium]